MEKNLKKMSKKVKALNREGSSSDSDTDQEIRPGNKPIVSVTKLSNVVNKVEKNEFLSHILNIEHLKTDLGADKNSPNPNKKYQ